MKLKTKNETRTLKSALTICSNVCLFIFLLLCSGCLTIFGPSTKEEWPLPDKPSFKQVHYETVENGILLSEKDASILVDNIDELKAYVLKLEALIEEMKKYYEAD